MYVMPTSTRLLRGMLTPAMRAMRPLPLPLLVTRVLADHEHPPVAADDLALLAHRLDRRSYLHGPFRLMIQTGWLWRRSEEHTSELQSRQYLVCRLLLEKKK